VALSGDSSATAITGANGNYAFAGLANGSYTVTPSRAGFTFNPASSQPTVSGANTPGVNFIATQVPAGTYSISGQVTYNGSGVSGVFLTLYSGPPLAVAYTDANGNYVFTGLVNGSYIVFKGGIDSVPPFIEVTVSGADITGANFILTVPCLDGCCGCWDY
jgi:hypothetical protein